LGHYRIVVKDAFLHLCQLSSSGRSRFLSSRMPDLPWPVLLLAGLEAVEIAPGDTYVMPLAFVSYPYSSGRHRRSHGIRARLPRAADGTGQPPLFTIYVAWQRRSCDLHGVHI
jgi:hypothetical protein